MFSTDDTIVAIATPSGRGGLGVVRLSGPRAHDIACDLIARSKPLEPRRATFATMAPSRLRRPASTEQVEPVSGKPSIGDEVVVTCFPQPRSYTGQDVVEISAHGSPVVLRAIVERAIDAGARLAEPGEFTLRAYLSGKRDLVQAEAVADLIDAVTPLQARAAFDQLQGTLTGRIREVDARLYDLLARLEASLDFPDEGYHFIEPAAIGTAVGDLIASVDALLESARRGRLIREGATVVIAGRPNVGKSSIFNSLVGSSRAIVSEVPGTTRDLLTERIDLDGVAITLVDTAGSRDTLDLVEREGVRRGDHASDVADVVLLVLDAQAGEDDDDRRLLARTADRRRLIVANKSEGIVEPRPAGGLAVSALTGAGMDDLRRAIVDALHGQTVARDEVTVTNIRHIALLRQARELLHRGGAAAERQSPEEIVLADLQAARTCFDEIVGTRAPEDLLRHIFERFCIGK